MIDMTDEELGYTLECYDAGGSEYFTSPNYAKAILGLGLNGIGEPVVVYDYELMVDCLVEDEGISRDEAYEQVEEKAVHMLRFMGNTAPIIVKPFD